MQKILVTGGAGFIGSNFVHYVYEQRPDWHVTVFDSLTYAVNLKNLEGLDGQRYHFIEADITDQPAIDKAVAEADAVVHFAAESHVDRSIAGPGDFVVTNCVGTNVVMQACRTQGIGRIVHVSTDEVYGSVEEGFSGEDDALDPERVRRDFAGNHLSRLQPEKTSGTCACKIREPD